MHTCIHPLFLPRSHSSIKTHTVIVACSVMDAGQKDGEDGKVSCIRVCGPWMYVCSQSGVHALYVCVCLSLCVCACRGRTQLKADSASFCRGNTRLFLSSLFCFLEQLVCLSSDCYGADKYFFLCLSYRCFLILDELSKACMASLLHLLLPFVP